MVKIGDRDPEDLFYDSKDDGTTLSASESASDCADCLDSGAMSFELVSGNTRYEVWMGTPASVQERRDKFLKWMDVIPNSDGNDRSGRVRSFAESGIDVDCITRSIGTVLGNSCRRDGLSSSRASFSSISGDAVNSNANEASEERLIFRIRNLDDGTEFIVHEYGEDGMPISLQEVFSNHLYSVDEFQRSLGMPTCIRKFVPRKIIQANVWAKKLKRRKKRWLRKLGAALCVPDGQDEEGQLANSELEAINSMSGKIQRVKVRPHKKGFKEFSALYMDQEIRAHKGLILALKFSPDGQYLASAGEDSVVRVWQVMECARRDDGGILESDPSCAYFNLNDSGLSLLHEERNRKGKSTNIRKTRDSPCVIFPSKTFRILETPIHEFHGHTNNVLDLSWSWKKYLLSSSEDKTVRLWQVGCSRCLRVFSHNNYVTCVQFNPIDEDYFISGSIDGKVRIWTVFGGQVVDWTDIKEMVTAVCYRPDGQEVLVGSIRGDCHIYDATGNHLHLNEQICLQGKKKSPLNRIINFQFSPSDPGKVLAISADSYIRILDGVDIISKYGIWSSGRHISASFTSDGKYIISASDDSNVYIWNYQSPDSPISSQLKSIQSCEQFICDSSVAIPWPGMRSETLASNEQISRDSVGNSENLCHRRRDPSQDGSVVPFSSQNSFSLSHELHSDSLPKASAAWLKEKLHNPCSISPQPSVCESQYEQSKASCQNMVTCHAWGLVIVTAGYDGRLRSFHNYGLPVFS